MSEGTALWTIGIVLGVDTLLLLLIRGWQKEAHEIIMMLGQERIDESERATPTEQGGKS